jgi:subtilisin family serine protease
VADSAYFAGTVLVCAANNLPGPTYPSQLASVLSVAACPGAGPRSVAYNVRPPVELGARGIDVDVAWSDGGSIVATATASPHPHVSGLVALMLSKHPGMTPFQVKAVLHAVRRASAPSSGGPPG